RRRVHKIVTRETEEIQSARRSGRRCRDRAAMCERLGEMWFGTFAGAVVVEATKQIYAAKPAVECLKQRRRVLLPMPGTPSPAGP
ncbi:MAG TPA: hypothetical protein VGR45_07985, partial [Stellaceae bacterium]|nr:hypothetical protein [Stellaceae bacterium]